MHKLLCSIYHYIREIRKVISISMNKTLVNQSRRYYMKNNTIIYSTFLAIVLSSTTYTANYKFNDCWGGNGFTINENRSSSIIINYSTNEISISRDKNDLYHKIAAKGGLAAPAREGYPNLPGNSRFIAIPDGAQATYKIINFRSERFQDIDVEPAPKPKSENDDRPMQYIKNEIIYNTNTMYPSSPVNLSNITKIRGVSCVALGITPFQYNPVTKELIVYKDIELEINISGSSRNYGEKRLRNRWWDAILDDILLNNSDIPKFTYNRFQTKADGCDYLIIIPDNEGFIRQANRIKTFRQKQGIITKIATITEIGGNSVSAIENYINNAYNNWDPAPAACLLMADYGTSGNTIISSRHTTGNDEYITDNVFADVDVDEGVIPDIVFSRMPGRNEAEIKIMVDKFIKNETTPPTSIDFYTKPVIALGWELTVWFQFTSETIYGYFKNNKGINPQRIYSLYTNSYSEEYWQYGKNGVSSVTTDWLNHFGNSGLGYIPDTPAHLLGMFNGSGQKINTAINSGAFLIQHRDHGNIDGWSTPLYKNEILSELRNTDLTYFFSLNCLTGRFNNTGYDCFAETLMKQTYNNEGVGALGVIAATKTSYSIYNDLLCWGLYDAIFPEFLPEYGSAGKLSDKVLPCFANLQAKIYLKQTSLWEYGNGVSQRATNEYFHHFGDAFTNMYTEAPKNLTVSINNIVSGKDICSFTADEGATIALTVENEKGDFDIIGTAIATGTAQNINVASQPIGTTVYATTTKQNYFRHSMEIKVISTNNESVIYESHQANDVAGNNNGILESGETVSINLNLKNHGTDANNITVTLSTTDPLITISDNTENYGSITSTNSKNIDNAFSFVIKDNVPDMHNVKFKVETSPTGGANTVSYFSAILNSPKLVTGDFFIENQSNGLNNMYLDAGESATIRIPVYNAGSVDLPSIIATLNCPNTNVVISNSNINLDIIEKGSCKGAEFDISINNTIQANDLTVFTVKVSSGDYEISSTYNKYIGLIIESFESNTFWNANYNNSLLDWDVDDGDINWEHSNYCSWDGDKAVSSELTLQKNRDAIIQPKTAFDARGSIQFHKKMSSDENVGTLSFYIDDVLIETWKGNSDWSKEYFECSPGEHNFKWVYNTGDFTNTYSGCSWIDNIIFGLDDITNSQYSLPSQLITTLHQNYPNPFYHATNIKFDIDKNIHVKLSIYNAKGKIIENIINKKLNKGHYIAQFDGKRLSTGVYFYKLTIDSKTITKSMVLLR